MIEDFLNQYYNIRSHLYSYGSSFSGIYLALILTFLLIVVYEHATKAIKTYMVYISVFFATFFIPSLLSNITDLFFGMDYGLESYMIMPAMLISTISFCLIIFYYEENGLFGSKEKCRYAVCLVFLLALVEASVPLQLTFSEFALPEFQGKNNSDVIWISEIIGERTVILPSDLQAGIKEYNWNTNIPLDYVTDNGDLLSVIFETAKENNITYVVIKHEDNLGSTNDEDISTTATQYSYHYIENVGEYVIYNLQ